MASIDIMTRIVIQSQLQTRFLHLLPGGPGGPDVYNNKKE